MDEHVVRIGMEVDISPVRKSGDEYRTIVNAMQAATERALATMTTAMERHNAATRATNSAASLASATIAKSTTGYKALSATVANTERVLKASAAASVGQARGLEDTAAAIKELNRQYEAARARIEATQGGTRELAASEQARLALLERGISETGEIGRQTVEHAASLERLTQSYRDAAAAEAKRTAELSKEQAALDQLEKAMRGRLATLRATKGGTEALTETDRARIGLMQQGIALSSELGRRTLEYAATIQRMTAEYKAAAAAEAQRARAAAAESEALARLQRETQARLAEITRTEGGLRELTEVEQVQIALLRQGIPLQSAMAAAMLQSAQAIDALTERYRQAASAAAEKRRVEASLNEVMERETTALRELERATAARVYELRESAGGVERLNNVQRAHADLIRRGISEYSRLGQATLASAASLDQMEASFRRVDRTAKASSGRIAGYLNQMAASAVAAYISVEGIRRAFRAIESTSNAASTIEDLTNRFVTFTHSAEVAEAAIAELRELGLRTPFELAGLAETTLQLQVFERPLASMEADLLKIGNAAAAAGADMENLGNWFGRGYAAIQAGKPLGEVHARLLELGVATPKTITQIERLRAAGASTTEIWTAFEAQFARFDGAMERQSQTLSGLKSTYTDSYNELLATIGDNGPLIAQKNLAAEITTAMNTLKADSDLMADAGRDAAEVLFLATSAAIGVAQAGAEAYQAWQGFRSGVGAAFNALTSVSDLIPNAMTAAWVSINNTLARINTAVGQWTLDALEMIQPFTAGLSASLDSVIDTLTERIGESVKQQEQWAARQRENQATMLRGQAEVRASIANEEAANLDRARRAAEYSARLSDLQQTIEKARVKTLGELNDAQKATTKTLDELTKHTQEARDANNELSNAMRQMVDNMALEEQALKVRLAYFGESEEKLKILIQLHKDKKEVTGEAAQIALGYAEAIAKLKAQLEAKAQAAKAAADADQKLRDLYNNDMILVADLSRQYEVAVERMYATAFGTRELSREEEARLNVLAQGTKITQDHATALIEHARRLDELDKIQAQHNGLATSAAALDEELQQWREAQLAIGLTARELDAMNVIRRASIDLNLEQVDALLAVVDAYHDAARANEAWSNLAQSAMDTITQAGLDLWSGQLDGFSDFRDAVLDGLAEIAAQMLTISAIQWVLPSSLGGVGGAFNGFGATDLGTLLGGGSSGGGLGGVFGSGWGGGQGGAAFNVGAYAGPALASVAIVGSLAAAIDSISDGGLFGTSWDTLSHTVEVSISDGILGAFERLERERERSLFRGTETEVVENSFGDQALASIQQMYEQIDTYVTQTAEALGFDVGRRFVDVLGDSFSVGVVAGENLAGAVSRYLERFGERWVSEIAPGIELTVQAGEDLYAAFGRIAQGAGLLAENLAPLGTTLDQLIGADWIASVIEQMALYQANELQAGVLRDANLSNLDPLNIGFALPSDGVITDEMRAQIEETARQIADAMGAITADVEAVLWDGADAFEAAKIVYINRLEELAGGQEALAARFQAHAETWQVSTEVAQSSLEIAMEQVRDALAAQFEALNTSRADYLADYEAAVSGALTPEQLDAWVSLGVEIGRLMEYERELARVRGEAVDVGSLTANQRAALDTQLDEFNQLMENMGLTTVESAQALLDLEAALGSVDEIASQLERVYNAMVPEVERNARSMEALQSAANALGINLESSAADLRDQYINMYNAAIALGDTDLVAQLDEIFGGLLDHINDLEQQDAAAEQQRIAAAEAAQQAADALDAFNHDLGALGLGLAYSAEQADVLIAALGSLDAVAAQWQIVWDDMFTAAERAEITLSRTGDALATAGVDVNRLSEQGAAYYRDLLLYHQRLGDTARVAELLSLADEVRDWVDASAELAAAAENAAAETAAWAESVSNVQSRIAGMIQSISDNGLVPTSQIDAVNASIERMRQLIADAGSIQEELRLQEELAQLVTQRYEIERQGILEVAQTSLDAENNRIRRINEAAQAAYQTQLAYVRELQRVGQSATNWLNRNATTNLAPVTQIGIVSDQFAAAVEAVMSGQSTDANITGLADQYLSLAESVYGAAPDFYAISSQIEAALSQVSAYAAGTETPVEPPEIPLMRELRDYAELAASVDAQIVGAQRESIGALNRISDRTAELMEEAAQQEEAHRAAQVAHWESIQAATRNTETSSDEINRTGQQNWPVVVGHLSRLADMTITNTDYTGRMYQLMTGGVPLELEVRNQMTAQTGLLGQIRDAVQAGSAGTQAALWAVVSTVQTWELPPIEVTVINEGGGGNGGDPDLANQDAAKRSFLGGR